MLNPEFRPFLGLLALAKPFPDTLAAPHHAELYGTSRRRVLRPKSGREGEAVEVPVPMFCGCVGRWILVEEGALILSGQEKKGIRRRAGRLARELGKNSTEGNCSCKNHLLAHVGGQHGSGMGASCKHAKYLW